jgi:hypothetical protein
MRLRKGPVIAALYPVVVLLGELVRRGARRWGRGLRPWWRRCLGRTAGVATGLAGIAWRCC